jgi:hypothetical protein
LLQTQNKTFHVASCRYLSLVQSTNFRYLRNQLGERAWAGTPVQYGSFLRSDVHRAKGGGGLAHVVACRLPVFGARESI